MVDYFTDLLVRAGFYLEHYGTGSQNGWFVTGFGFCAGVDWSGRYLEWCGGDQPRV